MVEQRTIIDHKLYHILFHPDAILDEREEYILKPVEVDGNYFAQIPNWISYMPISVKKDTEIKVVYFSRRI